MSGKVERNGEKEGGKRREGIGGPSSTPALLLSSHMLKDEGVRRMTRR